MAAAEILNVNVEVNKATFASYDSVMTPIFVLEIDEQERPVYAAFNAFACNTAGLSVENLVGKTAEEVYGGRYGALAYARHIQAMLGGFPVSYELTLPLRGKPRTVRTHLEPIFDTTGDVGYLIGTSADMSEAQELRETRIDAETQVREIENFVSLAAHDLRSPMRQISSLL